MDKRHRVGRIDEQNPYVGDERTCSPYLLLFLTTADSRYDGGNPFFFYSYYTWMSIKKGEGFIYLLYTLLSFIKNQPSRRSWMLIVVGDDYYE